MATVLAIDDHPEILYVLLMIVKRLGYRVLSANTAEAGLAILVSEIPDLIIVDQMMPGMDGLEFIRLCRTSVKTATIPIILFTALTDKLFIENAIAKGANEVWSKGNVEPEEIRKRLAHYLKGATPPEVP